MGQWQSYHQLQSKHRKAIAQGSLELTRTSYALLKISTGQIKTPLFYKFIFG